MSQRIKVIVKDILIFAALVFLVSVLVHRLRKYIHLQKQSLIHELDSSFFDMFQKVQRHAGIARHVVISPLFKQSESTKKTTSQIGKLMDEIERKYTRNAPSLALLGPIGTTSIVLKERELQAKLLNVSFLINNIFATFLEKPVLSKEEQRDASLSKLIDTNTTYSKEAQRKL